MKLKDVINSIRCQRDLFKMDEESTDISSKYRDIARVVRKQLDVVLHLLNKIDK